MPVQIILDNHTFDIIHRTNKKIKRVSLSISNKDEITIKTPLKFKTHLLKEIIFEHKDWILKSIQKVPTKNKFEFITGGEIPYLGVKYPLTLVSDDRYHNVKFEFMYDNFVVYHNHTHNYDDFISGLKLFYKYNAKKIIDPIFEKLSLETDLYPNKIGYRFAKTRWGSCSHINNISINYSLLQFELRAIEYVVLHELAHIKEKNHSKKFWDIVSFYMPEYKSVEKLLKGSLF